MKIAFGWIGMGSEATSQQVDNAEFIIVIRCVFRQFQIIPLSTKCSLKPPTVNYFNFISTCSFSCMLVWGQHSAISQTNFNRATYSTSLQKISLIF